jgi:hypothetical protein
MQDERECVVRTENYERVSVSRYDKDFWVHVMHRNGTSYITLNREQIEQFIAGLQKILSN